MKDKDGDRKMEGIKRRMELYIERRIKGIKEKDIEGKGKGSRAIGKKDV